MICAHHREGWWVTPCWTFALDNVGTIVAAFEAALVDVRNYILSLLSFSTSRKQCIIIAPRVISGFVQDDGQCRHAMSRKGTEHTYGLSLIDQLTSVGLTIKPAFVVLIAARAIQSILKFMFMLAKGSYNSQT